MTKLDKELIESKIAKLREYLTRLENINLTSKEEFIEDVDVQDLLVFRLVRCVELAIDIATHIIASMKLPRKESTKEIFLLLGERRILSKSTAEAMSKAAGFRNLAVHEYDTEEFNVVQVFKDYKNDIKDLKAFSNEVSSFLRKK